MQTMRVLVWGVLDDVPVNKLIATKEKARV